TLTKGTPVVIKSAFLPNDGDAKAIIAEEIAASIARHSRHPISQAIAAVAKSENPIQDWEGNRGSGSRGTAPVDSTRKFEGMLGSLKWLRENGVDSSRGDELIKEWSTRGATVVGLSIDSRLYGLFALSDTLKDGTREVIQQLRTSGLTPYLITGDNPAT